MLGCCRVRRVAVLAGAVDRWRTRTEEGGDRRPWIGWRREARLGVDRYRQEDRDREGIRERGRGVHSGIHVAFRLPLPV